MRREEKRLEYRIDWPFYEFYRFISNSDRHTGSKIDIHVIFKYGRALKTEGFSLLTKINILLQDIKLYNTYLRIIDHDFINRY